MKASNPMYNKETRIQVANTIKDKIKTGQLTYKIGKEHHLFKGNRPFNLDVRYHLYNLWIKPVLERDGFKCSKCGSSKDLQVHHLVPLRDICNDVFKELGIDLNNTLFTREEVGDDVYEKALTKVLENHKIDYGITLCKKCHEEVDYYYRPYKGESKNEN